MILYTVLNYSIVCFYILQRINDVFKADKGYFLVHTLTFLDLVLDSTVYFPNQILTDPCSYFQLHFQEILDISPKAISKKEMKQP